MLVEERGMLGISSKLRPGISIPLIGGREDMPLPNVLLDIFLDEELEDMELLDEKEEDDDDIIFEVVDPILIDPMFDLILLIISSIPRLALSMPPPKDDIPPNPPIPLISPPGMGPPDDIIVEEDEDEEVDLKLEIVEPSSDCVVAAILWLLAFSSFFTDVPSSVTNAWLWAFMASDT